MRLHDWLFATVRRRLALALALMPALMMSVFVFDLVGLARVAVGQGAHAGLAAEVLRTGIAYILVAVVLGILLAVLMSRAITVRLHKIRAAADAVCVGHH